MRKDILKYNESSFLDYGLYNGKIGLCMGYFIYAREQKAPAYAVKGQIMLEEVIDNIDELDSYSISNGLLGFGWAIEWMYKHTFVEIDTNEFLEDLDDEVYKLVIYNVQKSMTNDNGILEIILYLCSRISSKSPGQNFYRNICNCECLSILIDRLQDVLWDRRKDILKAQMNPDLMANALILLSKVYVLRINFDKVSRMMSMIINSVEFRLYYSGLRNHAHMNTGLFYSLEWAISLIYEKDYLFKLREGIWKPDGLNQIGALNYADGNDCVFSFLDSIDSNDTYQWKEAWLYGVNKR